MKQSKPGYEPIFRPHPEQHIQDLVQEQKPQLVLVVVIAARVGCLLVIAIGSALIATDSTLVSVEVEIGNSFHSAVAVSATVEEVALRSEPSVGDG